MKQKKNLLVFSNNSIYREVDIDEFEKDEILCGNTVKCDIKLKIKSNEDIIIKFRKINDIWQLVENEAVYYVVNGIKTPRKILVHGDMVSIKHNAHKGELLKISYFIDLQSSTENYDLKIKLNRIQPNTIGCDESKNIFIKNEFLGNSNCTLNFEDNTWMLYDNKTKYGVYVNGERVDKKTNIADNDFIVITGYKFFFKNGALYTSKYDKDIIVNNLNSQILDEHNKLFKYPSFLRSPRMLLNYPSETIEILKPPSKVTKPNNSLVLTLIPTVGMIGLTLYLGNSGNAMYMIGSALLTALVAILTFVQQKTSYKKESEKRISKYLEYIEEKEKEIQELINIQRNNMLATYQDINENLDTVMNVERRLWERMPIHKDFLISRIGTGSCNPTFNITYPKVEFKDDEDPIMDKPREVYKKYRVIENAPVLLPIESAGSIGVSGPNSSIVDFINNTTLDICANHYYEDVKLVYLFDKVNNGKFEHIKWLPHVWSDNKNMRFMASEKEDADALLKVIYKILEDREMSMKEKSSNSLEKSLPHYVLFISNKTLLENNPIVKFIGREKELGITFIFLYEYIDFLPKECRYIVTLKGGNSGTLQFVEQSENKHKFAYEVLSKDKHDLYAKKMSPMYISDSVSDASLTSSISLFELYKIRNINQINLKDYWSKSRVDKSMAVPLGVKLGDEVISLDLHEKYHGPHGLVAGTTGSGKSEILQSYISSMAINFHPHEVAFIIIDFKGGGMANQFKELPHLIGTITNIDGNQINRTLKSIEAELRRRQRLFSQFDVNHIDSYMNLYKVNKNSMEPLPHLIIIADEFAELKSEQPEFMAKLISAARIGRSLGVHLILATQKPAGVVDDQIWSNSKFKLCLKVQTKEDSREMLKTDVAADITQPGRSYLQVGNNEIFELFQSAWSGAKVSDEDDINYKDFEINFVDMIGRRQKLYSTKDNRKNDDFKTELEIVVNYINNYCLENNIPRVKALWLPPLDNYITINSLRDKFSLYRGDSWIRPLIGIYDNPEEQSQEPLYFNIAQQGNIAIYGSPGTGKTTMLQTMVFDLCQNHSADDINIYMLDFGGRTLKLLEDLPQVSAVVVPEEEVKVNTLLNVLKREINSRKEKFSKYGVNSLTAYREASGEKLPHMLVAIDNYAAFNEYYEDEADTITFISREGISLGITLVLTANQSSNINYRLSANMGIKVVLRCNDKGEYSNVIDGCRMEPDSVEGRGLIKIDKQIFEFQTALAVEGRDEISRAENIRHLVSNMKQEATVFAKKLPIMPNILKLTDVMERMEDNTYKIAVGVDFEYIENKYISLAESTVVNLLGPAKSGKTNMIKNICKTLEQNNFQNPVKLYILDSDKGSLGSLRDLEITREYINDSYELDLIVDSLITELEERDYRVKEGNSLDISAEEVLSDEPLLVLAIDNGDEIAGKLNYEYELQDKFKKLINDYGHLKFSVIICGTDAEFANDYSEGPKLFKSNGIGIVYTKLSNQTYYDLGYFSNEKELNIGDAYLVKDKKYVKIKTPICNI